MNQVSKSHAYLFLLAVGLAVVGLFAYMLLLSNKMSNRKTGSDVAKLDSQSQSDSVDSIERDLKETDLKDLDRELQDIDKELSGSY